MLNQLQLQTKTIYMADKDFDSSCICKFAKVTISLQNIGDGLFQRVPFII